MTRIMGVVSGKGGVGKTTVVANLGVALAKNHKKKVLLVDTNLTTPTLGYQLNIICPEAVVQDVLNDDIPAEFSIYDVAGVHVIPSAMYVSEEADCYLLVEKLNKIIGNYDVVLLDGAAGAGYELVSTIESSTEALVVTNPDVMALASALKVTVMVKNVGHPVAIVLNRVLKEKQELGPEEIESICDASVIAAVPEDRKVRESLARSMPVIIYDPCSPSSRAFAKLAAFIAGEPCREESRLEKVRRFLSSFRKGPPVPELVARRVSVPIPSLQDSLQNASEKPERSNLFWRRISRGVPRSTSRSLPRNPDISSPPSPLPLTA